jgi:putative methyltransferase
MPGARRKTVLISEPHAIENPAPFLPYVWAILKSYWERHGDDDDYYEWLPPIFLNRDPGSLLQPYGDATIDVLGLSCYTWNWERQCAIAKRIKASNPSCLVVAGGPQPDYKDPEFFREHPYIDAIAVKDGEITFSRILGKLMRADRDFRDVGGLYLPGTGADGHVCTGPAEVPTVFDHSPYFDQRAYYERLVESHRPDDFHATWESNRGCPYSCSFCDWGSSTMSKVRRFDMSRVEADVDMLARLGTAYVMSADANFGILARDLEIADLMVAAHEKYGSPKMFYYSAAKNNPERAIAIARKFARAGLCVTHTLAIQHTRKEVLAATDRANISADKQVAAAQALLESQIPINVQLILGIPGDTYELWKGCLADLMEWGIHEDYDTYFYSLLPNAPAAEQPFRERWEIETLDRIVFSDTAQPWKPGDVDLVRMPKSRIIVQSKTFSRDDWVRMFTYVALVKALHNASVTRLIAIYLRLTHNVPYLDFYQDLIERFFPEAIPARDWHRAVVSCYSNMLRDDDAMDRMPVRELPGHAYSLDPSRWLFVQVCLQFDAFFAALRPHLLQRYPQARNLGSVIEYQKNVVILPSYDRRTGKRFRTDLDWPRYFEHVRGRTGIDALAEPEPIPGARVQVSDQTCGEKGYLVHPLEWESATGEDRWLAWIRHTVVHRNSAGKKNFQQLRVEPPGLVRRLTRAIARA